MGGDGGEMMRRFGGGEQRNYHKCVMYENG